MDAANYPKPLQLYGISAGDQRIGGIPHMQEERAWISVRIPLVSGAVQRPVLQETGILGGDISGELDSVNESLSKRMVNLGHIGYNYLE